MTFTFTVSRPCLPNELHDHRVSVVNDVQQPAGQALELPAEGDGLAGQRILRHSRVHVDRALLFGAEGSGSS